MDKLDEFLSAFFPDPEEQICLRALPAKDEDDKVDPNGCAQSLQITRATLLPLEDKLQRLNQKHGIFIVINAGGDEDKCITRFNAVFCENDTLSIPEQHASLDRSPLPTSIRVETKKSVHAYWLLEGECTAAKWREVQKRLIAYFGSDTNIKNPSRVMRLPGFNHVILRKKDGGYNYKPIEIVRFEPTLRYRVAELLAAFPPAKNEPAAAWSGKDLKQLFLDSKEPPEGTGRNNPLSSWLGSLYYRGFQPEEALLLALDANNQKQKSDRLPEDEVQRTVESIYKTDARNHPPVTEWLKPSGLYELKVGATMAEIEPVVHWISTHCAEIDPVRRALAREEIVRCLKSVGVKSATTIADAALGHCGNEPGDEETQGQAVVFSDPEPWGGPVNGVELLNQITAYLSRFLILPEGAADAIALWVVHTYLLDTTDVSPILAITSPEKRCGKTRVLEILGTIVARPLRASNISPAAMFRAVEAYRPSLLIDEVDTFLEDNEDLRGIINSGHHRASAYVIRNVGDDHKVRTFSTWGAKALAKIGRFPGTIEDRSILIEMKRRAPAEKVERFSQRKQNGELGVIKRKVMRWAKDNVEEIKNSDPEDLPFLDDRANDNWRPLRAIADVCGGQWPELARHSTELLSGTCKEEDQSAKILVLTDIKKLFEDGKTDRLSSSEIVEALGKMENRPWPEWKHEKVITTRQLASLLRPFGIKPDSIRVGAATPKGYLLVWFNDTFSRYLGFQSATSATSAPDAGFSGNSIRNTGGHVADVNQGQVIEK